LQRRIFFFCFSNQFFTYLLSGFTVLAAGVAIPDAIGSVIVSRSGHGDMAISAVMCSNVAGVLDDLAFHY
jgi:Ca2+/Na+ antiporter